MDWSEQEIRDGEQTVEELAKLAPVILKFMPSRKIISKLI